MALVRLCTMAAVLAAAMPAQAESVADWAPYIAEASRRFDVPAPWIRRVLQAESGGRTTLDGQPIRSGAGAIGLMQLMPGTWAEMRQALGLGADPDDPRDNILAGTWYLRLMYDRFGYPGLFAAYNAGPGRYAEHLADRRSLPAETLSYLRKVSGEQGSAAIARPALPADTLFALPQNGEQENRQPAVSSPSDLLFAVRHDVP